MAIKPEILKRSTVAKSRLFRADQLHLRFSNGEERLYEKLCSRGNGAVLIVPLLDEKTVFLVREYAGGLEDYHMGLPKGAMDAGESMFTAANRELMEEVGFGARRVHYIKRVYLSPSYMEHSIHILIAEGLYPAKREGDEPEPLEVVACPFDQVDELVMRGDVLEGRTIAALYMAKAWREGRLTPLESVDIPVQPVDLIHD